MMDHFQRLPCEADARVQGADPGARFCAALGEPAGGSGATAESIKRWTFTFYGVKNKTDTITSTDGSFGPVEGASMPPFGDQIIKLPIARGLSDAVRRLHEAGYRAPFSWVLLRWPL